jgi:4-amino-4-deoxy-L-arabinose transferase-like glycosyltransferase
MVLGLAAVWRLGHLGSTPLVGDEAYYWLWSRHLDIAYYDHPAGVALLIRLSTLLGGDGESGIRWLNALLGIGAVGWVYAIGQRLYGRASALLAATLVALAPPYLMTSRFVYTDALQLFLLLCNLWLLLPLLEGAEQPAWRYMAQGITMALLFNTQYDTYLYALAMLALIAWRRRRNLAPLVRDPRVWLGAAIAMAGVLPTLLWNAAHDWASFRWQHSHFTQGALYRAFWLGGMANTLDYISAPLLLVAALGLLRVRDAASRNLLWPGLVLVLPALLGPANSQRNLSTGLALLLIPGASLAQEWASRLVDGAGGESSPPLLAVGRLLGLLTLSVGIVLGAGALGRAALLHRRGQPIVLTNLFEGEAWGILSYLAVLAISGLAILIVRALQPARASRADVRGLGAGLGWALPALLIAATGIYGLGTVAAISAWRPTPLEATVARWLPRSTAASAAQRDTAGWRALDPQIVSTDGSLFAVDYSLAGQLAYYTGKPVYSSGGQFRLWPEPPLDPALVLARGDLPLETVTSRLQELYAQVEGPQWATHDTQVALYYWRVEGLRVDAATLAEQLDLATLQAAAQAPR